MSQILTANATISFSENGSNAGLRLVEDKDRDVTPLSRVTPKNVTVSCRNTTYVRLYPPATGTTVVVAASGSLTPQGQDIETDATEIVAFTPESNTQSLPRGITNVRIEQVGVALQADGTVIGTSFIFDAVRLTIRSSVPCYASIKIKYDAPYTLYLYKFSGACPDTAPPKFDPAGNAVNAVGYPIPRYMDDGLLAAIDPAVGAYTTLHLEAPACQWTTIATSFLDSDKDKIVPTLKIEIDPDYPVRLVNSGTALPSAECCLRIYPAGAATSTLSTSGIATRVAGFQGVRKVVEVKQFTNSALASLDYPPAGSISAFTLGTVKYLGDASGGFVKGPGDMVVDVTYVPDGNGRYTNPRPRKLGSNEMALVDLFNHPVPAHGLVQVEYSSTYDLYTFVFDIETNPSDGSDSFAPAFFVAGDALGRAANIKLDPPSTRDKTKSMR